jgi:nucleotide-binding universal stress UspA family protein
MDNTTMQQTPFKNILFCTDFSENASHAFDHAVRLAQQNPGCKLTMLHVVPEIEAQFWKTYIYEAENVDQKAKQDIDDLVDKTYRTRIPQGLAFKAEFRVGKDSLEILDYAE